MCYKLIQQFILVLISRFPDLILFNIWKKKSLNESKSFTDNDKQKEW